MENAARAVWLLHPRDRATRIARRPVMQRNEIRASCKMRELVDCPRRLTRPVGGWDDRPMPWCKREPQRPMDSDPPLAAFRRELVDELGEPGS